MIKSRGHRLILLFLLLFGCGTSVTFGQVNLLYYNKVDTLSFGQRFNLKSNFVDWVTLTPNLGVEFALNNKNWNLWTVGMYGRFTWNTNSKENAYYVYDLMGGRLELRRYWHSRMPKRVFYVGVYGGANKFDIKLSGTGKKGQSFVGGLMFGTVSQLYGYQNGARLDLDLGINAGVVFAKWHEYKRELIGDKYVYTVTEPETDYQLTFSPWIYAASTDILNVSLVYHFGTKLSNRYKKRLQIDNNYRIALEAAKVRRDSINTVLEKMRRHRADSLEKVDYEKRFEQQHLELERKYQNDSLRKVNEVLREEQLKERAEAKRVADSLKVVEREKAIEERANAKRMADSLKVVNAEKAKEERLQKEQERENAKRTADSLRVVQKNQEQEAQLQKAKAKEDAKRERDSLKQTNELKRQEAIKAKEEEKELKKRKKAEEKTNKEKKENSKDATPAVSENSSTENNSSESDKQEESTDRNKE